MGATRTAGLACVIACFTLAARSWAGDVAVATFPFCDGNPVADLQFGETVLHMLIETGATRTVVDAKRRTLLGSKIKTYTVGSLISASEAAAFSCPKGSFGNAPLHLTQVICADLGPELAAAGIDGLLGMDFLARYCLDLDWDRGVVRFSRAIPEDIETGAVKLGLTYDSGRMPQIRAKLSSDSEATFGVDTGFSGCVALSPEDEVVAFPQGASPSIPYHAAVFGGQVHCREARLGFLQVGEIKCGGLLCTVRYPAGCATRCGLDFLSEFRAVFDFPNNALVLVPRKRASVQEADMSGITLACSRDKFIVDCVDDDSPASEAGIRAGDEILSIESPPGLDLRQVGLWSLLRSGDGKVIKLRVRHHDDEQTVELTLRKRI